MKTMGNIEYHARSTNTYYSSGHSLFFFRDKVITSKVFEDCGTTEPELCKNAK